MSERNFFAELKRRNVYKVAVAYAIVASAFELTPAGIERTEAATAAQSLP